MRTTRKTTTKRRRFSFPRKKQWTNVALPKAAIDAFHNRKRRDLREWKDCSDEELEEEAVRLDVAPDLWDHLRPNQRVRFLLAAIYRKFADFSDTGTGKTFVALAWGRWLYDIEEHDRLLVLVPIRSNKYEWAREIKKHMPGTKYVVLEGSTKHKWQQIEENPDALFVIETYMGFVRLLCKLVNHKRKKDKQKLEPDLKLVRKFTKLFRAAISDEGTVLGDRDNLPRRLLRQVVKEDDCAYLNLTGTPFGRDPTLVHSQMQLVDGGWTLGETLGLFRAGFFHAKENPFGGIDYTFDKAKKKLLHEYLAHQSIRYNIDQADLPEVVHVIDEVELDESAEVWIERTREVMQRAKGNYREIKNAFLRMRQISSGFIGYKDDESGDRAEVEFDSNPKLDQLLYRLESVDPSHKAIVYHEFHYSSERIAAALKKAGIGHLQLYGKTRDPQKVLHRFDDDPDAQVLILSNPMAIGLNLQIARYGFVYESAVSVIQRTQALRRFIRQGSKHDTVFLCDSVVLDTFDQRILDFHEEGRNLFKAIMDGSIKL